MSANLNSATLYSTILNKKITSLIHCHSTWWWQPSWILPSWIQLFCTTTLHSVQNSWIQDGRIQDGCHHKVESEWMSEVFFLFKMAESKMAEFKMSNIIKLSENELVWDRVVCENCWIQDGSIQDGCHHKVQSEWMSEIFFGSKWLNQRWQISRWLTSSS